MANYLPMRRLIRLLLIWQWKVGRVMKKIWASTLKRYVMYSYIVCVYNVIVCICECVCIYIVFVSLQCICNLLCSYITYDFRLLYLLSCLYLDLIKLMAYTKYASNSIQNSDNGNNNSIFLILLFTYYYYHVYCLSISHDFTNNNEREGKGRLGTV